MPAPIEKNHELKKRLTYHDGSLLNSSRKMGISYDHLISIISGRTQPTAMDVEKISKHLGLLPKHLFKKRNSAIRGAK